MHRFLVGLFPPFLVIVTVLAPGRQTAPFPAARSQAQKEPLEYFQDLMPVLTHARCMNCHGEVDPSTGLNHDGGVIGAGESCTASGCHTQADNANQTPKDDWKITPSDVWFVRLQEDGSRVAKDAKALCDQMADRVMNHGRQDFMDHLQSDLLIDLGFVGLSGGANDGTPVSPPMAKGDFLVAAARWMDDGFAACDREGIIIHTEEIASDETQEVGTGMRTRFEQNGRRTVTIRFADGEYRAEVEVRGQTRITQTITMETSAGPCTTTITSTGDYQDAGPVGSGGALGNIPASASLDVKFQPDSSYLITVLVGEEKYRRLDRYTVRDGCGTGVQPSPSETVETVWRPTRFVIPGKLRNPADRSLLVGRTMRVLFTRASGVSRDDNAWLHSHYGLATQSGLLHPVTVKTIWNIRHRP